MPEIKLDVPKELTPILGNVTLPSINLGTDELADFTKLYYSACEAYEKAMANGSISLEDALLLNSVIFGLFAAFTGASVAVQQALDLTDEELIEQVNVGDNYQLGTKVAQYKQIWKALLTAVQTYSVFR